MIDSPPRHSWNVVRMVLHKLLELCSKRRIFFQVLHGWVGRAPQEALPEPIEGTRNVRVCADDKWQTLEGTYASCYATRYFGLRIRQRSLY